MFDRDEVWETITRGAESLIQREYGSNWNNSKSDVARLNHCRANGCRDGNKNDNECAKDDDEIWEDLSSLTNADYRDLISALYENLSDEDEHDLAKNETLNDWAQIPYTKPELGLESCDDDFSVDAHFLHSQIIPNSRSASDVFEFIVQNSTNSTVFRSEDLETPFAAEAPIASTSGTFTSGSEATLSAKYDDNNALGAPNALKIGGDEAMRAPNVTTNYSEMSRNGFNCLFCKYSTTSRTQFWRHRKIFSHFSKIRAVKTQKPADAAVICCELCEYKAQSKFNMLRHVHRIHVAERRFKCAYCEKCFKDAEALKTHCAFRHSATVALTIFDDSAKSGSREPSPASLADAVGRTTRWREKSADDATTKKCADCEKCFKTRSDLLRHFRIVHEKRRAFACSSCGKCFQTNANAKRHFVNVCARICVITN